VSILSLRIICHVLLFGLVMKPNNRCKQQTDTSQDADIIFRAAMQNHNLGVVKKMDMPHLWETLANAVSTLSCSKCQNQSSNYITQEEKRTHCTNNFKIEPGPGTKSLSSEKGD
jgi:hypothetical protein